MTGSAGFNCVGLSSYRLATGEPLRARGALRRNREVDGIRIGSQGTRELVRKGSSIRAEVPRVAMGCHLPHSARRAGPARLRGVEQSEERRSSEVKIEVLR